MGRYKGEFISRVPIRHIVWLMNNSKELSKIAKVEYERRGFYEFDIELTAHAVNQASLKLQKHWVGSRKSNEGIFSWLGRMADLATKKGTDIGHNRVGYKKMIFVFDDNSLIIRVLKTVMPAKKLKVRSTKIKFKNRRRVSDIEKR